MASCIPFDFALIDRRHRPFVEGRRDVFLTPFQLIGELKRFQLICNALVAAFFLYLGASGLMHDFSIEWNTAEGVITECLPSFLVASDGRGSSSNWWCFYSFKTESGQKATGKIVLGEGERNRFSAGDDIPVVYVRNEPQDNRYANDPLPRGFLYSVLVGIGVSVLGLSSLVLRREIDEYRALRRLARLGHPVPGEVTKAQWVPWAKSPKDRRIDIEYMFSTPEGHNFSAQAQISASDVAEKAEPGVKVAVWYSPDQGCLLL